jgi:hypothetical protein
MKPDRMVSVIVARRKADGGHEPMHEEGEHEPAIMACAEDLIRAVEAKDIKGVAGAMKAAFEYLDAQPHEEGEHLEE